MQRIRISSKPSRSIRERLFSPRFLSNASKSNQTSLIQYPVIRRDVVHGVPSSLNPSSATNSTNSVGSNKIRIELRVTQKSVPSEGAQTKPSPKPSSPPPKHKLTLQELNNYLERNIGSYNHISSFSDLPLEFGYNQHISIDNELRERLRALLWKFNAPIKYAFAYGSGVFTQTNTKTKINERKVDLIFGVSYTEHWHSLNMRQNPHHYSPLRWFGSGAVSLVQDKIGAGLYFNPYVEMDGLNIRYGVVNIDTMLNDLHKWDTLFLAGRLHKPVKILRDEPRVRFVNQSNLISALRTALLILPEEFTELDLYQTIAGISYKGDPRMTEKDTAIKVSNIVDAQFLNFRNLYSSLLDLLPNVTLTSSSAFKLPGTDIPVASMKQDMDPVRRGNMVFRLPLEFRQNLYTRYQSKFESFSTIQDPEKVNEKETFQGTLFDQDIAADPNLTTCVSKALRSTVFLPSLGERAKGILTSGFF